MMMLKMMMKIRMLIGYADNTKTIVISSVAGAVAFIAFIYLFHFTRYITF